MVSLKDGIWTNNILLCADTNWPADLVPASRTLRLHRLARRRSQTSTVSRERQQGPAGPGGQGEGTAAFCLPRGHGAARNREVIEWTQVTRLVGNIPKRLAVRVFTDHELDHCACCKK